MASAAHATATVEGNVLLSGNGGATFYADNPFTTTVNEGIPTAGNSINENQGMMQTNFEGRPDNKGTATTVDDENVNFDIYVGRTSYGLLTINGGTELRDMNLIIGDSGQIPNVSGLQRGTGVVRIENPGSLYNNNPDILPWPFYETGVSPSINPRSNEPGASDGFDLFVGRNGTGDLAISLGGRAEIQDAVIVGQYSGSVGTVTIDGVGSFLQSGGFQTSSSTDPEVVNYMIIGSLGSGTMSITNGGQSYNAGPVSPTDTNNVFAAVIGSNLGAVNSSAPGAGGNGTVYVDGQTSKWTIAGNLQIGGFHDNRIGTGPLAVEDIDGNEVVYGSSVGRGTLNVSNGALVSIVTPPLDESATDAPDRLDLLVGAYGKINLDGGRIELIGAFDNQNPENPQQEVSGGRLINDGVVSGTGSITTLQLRNRVLGRIQVGAGQQLSFTATGAYSETDNAPVPGEPTYPLSNYGVVDVLGTETARAEIEFRRNPVTVPGAGNITRPFLNLPVTGAAAPNGRTEGLIHGEYSTMRFQSGLENRGVLAFTAGNNVVSGDVVNRAESVPGAGDDGTFIIGNASGTATSVVFEDDFINNGVYVEYPNADWTVLAGNSFVNTGTMNVSMQGSLDGIEYNPKLIAGNATFGGILNVSLSNGLLVPALSSVEMFKVGGTIFGNFADVNVIGSTLEFYTFASGGSFFLQSFDPALANGADLNGDGIVDQLDYAIWRQNFGESGTPGTVPGDANGDGIVDATDYTVWRDNCCGPFPGSGAGSVDWGLGGLGPGGVVPEPASGALLACAGLLAFAFGRRRDN